MERTELDPASILTALGIERVDSIAPVSGGFDTAIWRVRHGGETSALRVFRSTQGAAVEREVLAMRAGAAAGILVPRVRCRRVARSSRHATDVVFRPPADR